MEYHIEASQDFIDKNSFFFSSTGKLKTCWSSKLNFSSSCFVADDRHVKIEWLHVVVFSGHDILHF